jgi:hypothetical protein
MLPAAAKGKLTRDEYAPSLTNVEPLPTLISRQIEAEPSSALRNSFIMTYAVRQSEEVNPLTFRTGDQ